MLRLSGSLSEGFGEEILSELIGQALAGGVLMSGVDRPRECVVAWAPRVGLILSILEALERTGVAGQLPGIPFCYYSNGWTGDALAGETDPTIPASAVIHGYFRSWNLMADGGGAQRVLRALLWLDHHHGWQDALSYLVRAIEHGLFPRVEPTYKGLLIYLHLLSIRPADPSAMAFAIDPEEIKKWNASAWISADFKSEAITGSLVDPEKEGSVDYSHELLNGDLVGPQLHFLFESAIRLAERTRAASSLSDWTVRIHATSAFLRIMQNIIESILPANRPLSLRTIWRRLEEIKADSTGQVLIFRSELAEHPLRPPWTFQAAFPAILKANTEEWHKVIFEDRLCYPHALSEFVTNDPSEIDSLDTKWLVHSCQAAPAVLISLGRDPLFTSYLGHPQILSANDDDLSKAGEQLMYLLDKCAGSPPEIRLRALRELTSLYPWCAAVHWEKSIALDELEAHAEAISTIRLALIINPLQSAFWRSATVILNKLGEGSSAVLAAGVAEILEASQPLAM